MTTSQRNEIVVRWLPLAGKLSDRFAKRNPEFDREDAFQIAVIALMRGVERFDDSAGYKPMTFYYTCIWRALVSKVTHAFGARSKRQWKMQRLTHDVVEDRPEPWEIIAGEDEAQRIPQLMDRLTKREALFIRTHFLEQQTLKRTHRAMGISRTRGQQLKYAALRKMRA